MSNSKFAVIGSGIAGLSAAWLLSRHHDVTLFEAEPRPGGHANTVTFDDRGGSVDIDTGFIVYNERNYPNLTALFGHLGVDTAPSDMSFAVSIGDGRLEYSGDGLPGLFGQRRNLLRPGHWQLIGDILRFFQQAARDIDVLDEAISIGAYLEIQGYSRDFVEAHILPLSAAIWSTPSRRMLDFPARTLIRFFANHGLLQVNDRPAWRTVPGGSHRYVEALLADAPRLDLRTNAPVRWIRRESGGVTVAVGAGAFHRFDEVVVATHAPQALALLADATPAERAILGSFRTTANRAVLHTDPRLMPRRRHLWSAWNYLRPDAREPALGVTYWMNRLQPLPTATDWFVTLNPPADIDPARVHATFDYFHPLFDAEAVAAQRDLAAIQGARRTWFAGAWMGYGFHEDGLQSGLEAAERIGPVRRPWIIPGARDRIAHAWAQDAALATAAE